MEIVGVVQEPDGRFTLAGRTATLQEWESADDLSDLLHRETFMAGLSMAEDVRDVLREMRRAARRARGTK